MNYLEWKKRVLVYLVQRGKPIDALPEALDFYIYSKCKSFDISSLPTAPLTIALPLGISANKAVDSVVLAIKAAHELILNDSIAAAQAPSLVVERISHLNYASFNASAATDSLSQPLKHNVRLTADVNCLSADSLTDIAFFRIRDITFGTISTVCLNLGQGAAMQTLAQVATDILLTEISPTLSQIELNAGDKLCLGISPEEAFTSEIISDIDISADTNIAMTVEQANCTERDNVKLDVPVKMGVKVSLYKRLYISDFADITISELEGQPISDLRFKQIN